MGRGQAERKKKKKGQNRGRSRIRRRKRAKDYMPTVGDQKVFKRREWIFFGRG